MALPLMNVSSQKSIQIDLPGSSVVVNCSPAYRLRAAFVTYTLGLLFSLWLAYGIRSDFSPPDGTRLEWLKTALWIVPLKLMLLYFSGQFAGILGYFSLPDLKRIQTALGGASLIIAAVWVVSAGRLAPSQGVIVADFLISLLALSAVRLCFRRLRELQPALRKEPSRPKIRVGILGAGDAGAALALELGRNPGSDLEPVVFFDDNPNKWKSQVHGIPVLGAPELLLDEKHRSSCERVIIAMPTAPGKRVREIIDILNQSRVKFETVPSLGQLANGRVKVTQLRPVEIQDLLGREAVQLDTPNIRAMLEKRVVLVTGAGGSIGSELCRQIASFGAQRLILVEQSEVQMFQIEQELIDLGYQGTIVPFVADILDFVRMDSIFEEYKPEVVFHAAAHKHVPMMEGHPDEAIKNNVFGTAQVAELSFKHRVQRFVLISTDKAINPTNVMGATKRLAEIFLQSLAAQAGGSTRFMAVRFGNVLGSSGSVIPTFKNQIAVGGPVKVTHPDVTRYFMTIPEAVGLVLQSCAQGTGGEIFVLDMGKPVKIVDLARQLIELSGLRPGEDIEIQFVGLRPGEKLYEELCHVGEEFAPTLHPKIMRFVSTPLPISQVRAYFEELLPQLPVSTPDQIKLLLKKFVPEYQPQLRNEPSIVAPARQVA